MALNLTIEQITDEDYDGNPETVKSVCAAIDSEELHEYYTFETTVSDADIQTQVETDLTEKGYTW